MIKKEYGEIMKKLAKFFVSVKKEMKKVRWPHRKEMVKFSVATLLIIFFFIIKQFFLG